jgi:Flp pilus assembly protein TadG
VEEVRAVIKRFGARMRAGWQGRRRALASRARGIGVVEFALASLLFFPITLGTIDFGRAIFQYSELTNAVREGARYGKVNPTDTAGIRTRITDYAQGITIGTVTTSPSASPCDPGLCRLTVTANFQFNAITTGLINALLGGAVPASFTISSTATVEVE